MRKYNDGSWEKINMLESAARGDGTDVLGDAIEVGDVSRILVILSITASATEAGDTLDVYLDVSWDNSTWVNAIHFPQQAGNASAKKHVAALMGAAYSTDPDATMDITSDLAAGVVRQQLVAPFMRVRYTIADVATLGNESHTFSVVAYAN